jgi:hypothetical protein
MDEIDRQQFELHKNGKNQQQTITTAIAIAIATTTTAKSTDLHYRSCPHH